MARQHPEGARECSELLAEQPPQGREWAPRRVSGSPAAPRPPQQPGPPTTKPSTVPRRSCHWQTPLSPASPAQPSNLLQRDK